MMNDSEISDVILNLLKDMLELEEIPNAEDNFFELGGNSFKAFGVVTNLPEEWNEKLTISDFYDCETISEMISLLKSRLEEGNE